LRQTLAAFLVLAALLAGCATPPMPLSPQAHKAIESVQTILYVPQNTLDVDVTPGNPGGTGLLGALIVQAIDESRRASAQKAQITVVEAVNDFDFRTRMANQLSAEFGRVQSLRLRTPVQLETIDSDSQRRIAFDRSQASAVLFSRVSYKFLEGKIVVTASNLMYPKARGLMPLRAKPNDSNPLDDGNVIYRRTFTFTKRAVTRDPQRERTAGHRRLHPLRGSGARSLAACRRRPGRPRRPLRAPGRHRLRIRTLLPGTAGRMAHRGRVLR